MPKAGGKWSTMEITAKGRDLSIKFDGKRTRRTLRPRHASLSVWRGHAHRGVAGTSLTSAIGATAKHMLGVRFSHFDPRADIEADAEEHRHPPLF
jgi:hypothetical protein